MTAVYNHWIFSSGIRVVSSSKNITRVVNYPGIQRYSDEATLSTL